MNDPFILQVLLIVLTPLCLFLFFWVMFLIKELKKAKRLLAVSDIYKNRFLRSLTSSLMDTVPVKDR